MLNPAIRMLLLFPTELIVNIPPFQTFFWVSSSGSKFITDRGNRIVFKPT